MKEKSFSTDIENEGSDIFNVRLTPKTRQALWKLSEDSDESRANVVRKLIMGAQLHPRLTEEEKAGLKAVIFVEKNLVSLNNAINGLAKNMTETERKKFILNGKTLTEWTNVVSEAIVFYKEFKEKLLGK